MTQSLPLCLIGPPLASSSLPHWLPLPASWDLSASLGISLPHWASSSLPHWLPLSTSLGLSLPHWASSSLPHWASSSQPHWASLCLIGTHWTSFGHFFYASWDLFLLASLAASFYLIGPLSASLGLLLSASLGLILSTSLGLSLPHWESLGLFQPLPLCLIGPLLLILIEHNANLAIHENYTLTSRQFKSRLHTMHSHSGYVQWGGEGVLSSNFVHQMCHQGGVRVSLVPTLSTRCATGEGEGRGVLSQILPKTLAGYISVIKCVIAFIGLSVC